MMARKTNKTSTRKKTPQRETAVKNYRYGKAKRSNLPTKAVEKYMSDKDRQPIPYSPEVSEVREPCLSWRRGNKDISTMAGPLYVHDKIDPSLFVGHLIDQKDEAQTVLDSFNGLPKNAAYNWYKYKGNWSNRLIRGNSIDIMPSLFKKEGMGGQVQMVYFDPPYGIDYNSNYQASTRKREGVTPNESASVKAFRDSYENGIHSYLDTIYKIAVYAKDLLADSGSMFMQIGSTNMHRVALILDEVFGSNNRVATIPFVTSGSTSSNLLSDVTKWILWYAKDKEQVKYHQIYEQMSKKDVVDYMTSYAMIELPNGNVQPLTTSEKENPGMLPDNAVLCQSMPLMSRGASSTGRSEPFVWNSTEYACPKNKQWRVSREGLENLARKNRLYAISGGELRWKWYDNEIPGRKINNLWHRQMAPTDMRYVVETARTVIERCMLMTTDPGDLVLDPTCGRGNTAVVAERWGRRWITIDTSSVPIALCRQEITASIHPWYYTLDDYDGLCEEAKLANTEPPSDRRSFGEGSDPSAGFVYKRINRISAATLAYEKSETILLVDKPVKKRGMKRISSPFTVESHSPQVENPNRITKADWTTLLANIIEAMNTSGIRIGNSNKRIYLDEIEPWPEGEHLTHQAKMRESEERVALVILADDDTASLHRINLAAEEVAQYPSIMKLIIVAFEFGSEAYGKSTERRRRLHITKARANRDLSIGELKNKESDNAFITIGEPDVEVRKHGNKWIVEVLGYDVVDPRAMSHKSGNRGDIDCWMIDTNYNGEAFFARRIHFPNSSDEKVIKKLKSELITMNPEHWKEMESFISAPFDTPVTGRISVKIFTDTGEEIETVKTVGEDA